MQTKTHYTLYNLFLPWGMPSLSNLWPPITNLSQKQKQCSIVALNSFTAVGLFRGEDAVGTTQWRIGFIPAITQWQLLAIKCSDKCCLSSSTPLPKKHLPPNLLLWSCPQLLPLERQLMTVRRVHRWDLEDFASSLLVWILFTFCHWLATSMLGMQSLLHLRVLEMKSV